MCLRQKKHILKNSLSKQGETEDFRSKGGNEAECSLVTTNGLLLELKCPVILGWTWPGSSILYLSFFQGLLQYLFLEVFSSYHIYLAW